MDRVFHVGSVLFSGQIGLFAQVALGSTFVLLAAFLVSALLRKSSAAVRAYLWTMTLVPLLLLPFAAHILPQWTWLEIKQNAAAGAPADASAPVATLSSGLANVQAARSEVASGSDASVAGVRPNGAAAGKSGGAGSVGRLTDAEGARPKPPFETAASSRWRSTSMQSDPIHGSGVRAALINVLALAPQIGSAALVAWMVGAFLLLVRLGMALVRVRLIVRKSWPITADAWTGPCRQFCRQLGIERPVSLYESPSGFGPMTWGLWRPAIVVPRFSESWSESCRSHVLLHELAHVKRYDSSVQALAGLVRALYWFHPLAWLAVRRLHAEMEAACDDRVLAEGTVSHHYAEDLVSVARAFVSRQMPATAAIGLGRQSSHLETRLHAILDGQRNRRPVTIWTAAVGVVFGTALLLLASTAAISVVAGEFPDETPSAVTATGAVGTQTAAAQPLPGLVPEPVSLPGVGRWQIMSIPQRGYVRALAFSPDGKSLAVADSKLVRIVRTDDMTLVGVLVGHTGRITAVRYSADGTQIATSSADGTLRIWSSNGVPGAVLRGHRGAVSDVAWGPQGKIVSGGKDGTVRIWTAADGKEVLSIDKHGAGVNAVAWNSTGQWIAAGDDNKHVRLWTPDGADGPLFSDHRGAVYSVQFSPDGRLLAVGEQGYDPDDGNEEPFSEVRICSVERQSVHMLSGPTGMVQSVAWSPDGKRVAAVGWGGDVMIWSVDTGAQLPVNVNSADFLLFAVAFSPDGKELVTGGRLRHTRITNLENGTVKVLPAKERAVLTVAPSPDGKHVAVGGIGAGSEHKVYLLDSNGRVEADSIGHTRWVQSASWNPNGSEFITASDDGSKRMWDADGTPTIAITDGSGGRSAEFSPDGKWIAATSGNAAQLYSADAKHQYEFKGHLHGTTRVAWKPDSTQFATASFDSSVRIWNIDGTAGSVLQDVAAPTRDVAWSPDGGTIASAREDGTVKLWKPDGTALKLLAGHSSDYVEALAYSPDGKWLASASWDGTVRIWTAAGDLAFIYNGHDAPVFSVGWDSQSREVLSGGIDGTVRAWDPKTGRTRFVATVLEDGTVGTFDRVGQLIGGESESVDKEFVYLVEKPDGAMEIVPPAEFRNRQILAVRK